MQTKVIPAIVKEITPASIQITLSVEEARALKCILGSVAPSEVCEKYSIGPVNSREVCHGLYFDLKDFIERAK